MNNDPATQETTTPKKIPVSRFKFIVLTLFLFIITIIMLLGGQYLSNSVENLKSQQNNQTAELKKLQEQNVQLTQTVEMQKNQVDTLLSQVKTSKQQWVYSGATYLIQQAMFQLRLHNFETAKLLLNNARDALDNLPSAQAKSINQQLSQVNDAIKSVKMIDQPQMAQQIESLKKQVDDLPLVLPGSDHPYSKDRANHQPVWDQIKQLVVIRHRNTPVEPLIAPSEAVYLKQNLKLQLEQTLLALLYHDPLLYQSALQKTKLWTAQFFNLQSPATQNFLQSINHLLQVNVTTVTPKIFDTLEYVLNQLKTLSQVDATNNVKHDKNTHQEVSQ